MTETPNPNIVDTDTLTGEMHPIRRCVLAIGSNLGERLNNLQGAVNTLADTPDVWVTSVSPVYETAPVDAPDGSRDFLNAVVLADTTLSARTLLERALAVEDAYGRERSQERNAPRTLDVDLILVGDREARRRATWCCRTPRRTSGPSCSLLGTTSSPTPRCSTAVRSPSSWRRSPTRSSPGATT